jgi:hypothetical protein
MEEVSAKMAMGVAIANFFNITQYLFDRKRDSLKVRSSNGYWPGATKINFQRGACSAIQTEMYVGNFTEDCSKTQDLTR